MRCTDDEQPTQCAVRQDHDINRRGVNPVLPLLKQFWGICFLRVPPQDLPSSHTLMGLSLTFYFAESLSVGWIQLAPKLALPAAMLDTGFLAAMTGVVLWVRSYLHRYTQTFTALAGCGALMGIAALPVLAWQQQVGTGPDSGFTLPSLLLMLWPAWNIVVVGLVLCFALFFLFVVGFVVVVDRVEYRGGGSRVAPCLVHPIRGGHRGGGGVHAPRLSIGARVVFELGRYAHPHPRYLRHLHGRHRPHRARARPARHGLRRQCLSADEHAARGARHRAHAGLRARASRTGARSRGDRQCAIARQCGGGTCIESRHPVYLGSRFPRRLCFKRPLGTRGLLKHNR